MLLLSRALYCSIKHLCKCNTGGVFGLFVALTGERMPGGAVAMAEGNALGKGPVIFHLFDSGIEYIRSQAAGEQRGIQCLEALFFACAALSLCMLCLLAHHNPLCLAACLSACLSVCLSDDDRQLSFC